MGATDRFITPRNGSVGLRARNHVESDLDTFIFISLADCQRFVRCRPKLNTEGCDDNLLTPKKSNAGYRSPAIIQGANTDIVRLCQNKKRKRGLFSTKKDVHANASLVISVNTIIPH
ncbi:hypothetical phage protein [Streptococcus equi subsp. equi 4047]|uniref:Hypothetical phage protein n=1 Tax=Streptococcus equi subsp. equi (strain 4047) TaxID=553482 RepID=C0MBL4_STRE4|nr:hypothetical phage protein [Streptococcus equi subsp. equi 4047]